MQVMCGMNQPLANRIVFFGTPEFALPALEELVKSRYSVAAVITRPDERVGRKQILTPPPVKSWVLKHGTRNIEMLQPYILDERFKFQVSSFRPDLFIVAAYGKIIPKEILDIPRYGALNIHPSLLPRWRGPSPIQYAILAGDCDAGVTIMQMDEMMDHGPIVAQRQFAISKTTYPELHDALSKLGAKLLIETLPGWINGEITPIPQDDLQATYSKILAKDDGRVVWSKQTDEIERMVRAFNPWPGAWTLWPSESKILRVRMEAADIMDEEPSEGAPGFVWTKKNNPILVKTGRGSIAIKKLGIEGKKILDADQFLHGYPQITNSTFI